MTLLRIVLRRVWSTTIVMSCVSVITYGLIFLTPGDPAYAILRAQRGSTPTSAEVAVFRAEHGLDEPFAVQYVSWVSDVLRGDLGTSYAYSEPVSSLLATHLPNTIELAVAAMILSLLVAVPLGVVSATHHDTWIDRLSQLLALAGVSMPNFWLGYLLILGVSMELGLTPIAGSGTIAHLILPAFTLGTGLAAVLTRLVRTSMLDVLGAGYMDTARSKGLSERLVTYKHALRNAFPPVVTMIGLQLGFVLSGSVVVEVVFQRPGIGKLLVDSIFARDYPVVQGIVLLTAAVFVVVNQIVDLVYVLLDPRVNFGGES